MLAPLETKAATQEVTNRKEKESHCGIGPKQQRHEECLCERIDIGELRPNVLRGLIATPEALHA